MLVVFDQYLNLIIQCIIFVYNPDKYKIQMLAYVISTNQLNTKQSSIFPKLVGSKRRIQTEPESKNKDHSASNIYTKNSYQSKKQFSSLVRKNFHPSRDKSGQLIKNKQRSLQRQEEKSMYKKQDEQVQFLTRMKKARQIILSHQRRNKTGAVNPSPSNSLSGSKQSPSTYRINNFKSFSQIVYKISTPKPAQKKNYQSNQNKGANININIKSKFNGNFKEWKNFKESSKNKKVENKNNESEIDITEQGNQFYNDKILRQCMSQFKPNPEVDEDESDSCNFNASHKTNRVKSNIIDFAKYKQNKHEKIQKILHNNQKKPKDKSLFGSKVPNSYNRHKKNNNSSIIKNSAEKLLMKLNLNDQIISSNGSQLMQRLLKCRTQKDRQKQRTQSTQKQEQTEDKAYQNVQQASINQHQISEEKENYKQNQPSFQISKAKIKLKVAQKNKKKMPIKASNSGQSKDKQSEQLMKQKSQQQQCSNRSPNISELKKQLSKQIQKTRQVLQKSKTKQSNHQADKTKLNIKHHYNKQKHLLDCNFKLQGWNLNETLQFQVF